MAKGGQFERDVCRRLTAWWCNTDHPDDVLFWRTAGSGGRATVRARKGQRTSRAHCGDIAAVDGRGRELTELITWELKRGYHQATLHALVDRPESAATQQYEDWVGQAVDSSLAADSPYWAILHRRNLREAVLTCPAALLTALTPNFEFAVPCARVSFRYRDCVWDLASLPLEVFLSTITPLHVTALHARHFSPAPKAV